MNDLLGIFQNSPLPIPVLPPADLLQLQLFSDLVTTKVETLRNKFDQTHWGCGGGRGWGWGVLVAWMLTQTYLCENVGAFCQFILFCFFLFFLPLV